MTDKIAKANKAQALLNDETLQEAFAAVKQGILDKWSSLPVAAQEEQYQLKVSLSLLGNVEAALRSFVEDGKLEEFRIEQEKRPFLGDLLHGRGNTGSNH